jgi:hypothetical protein
MSKVWLLRQNEDRPERKDEPEEQVRDKTARPRWLCCRVCRAPIAEAEAKLDWGDRPLIFANPQGALFELLTVRDATGVHVLGEPTTDATWFSGYAWQVVICRRCLNHLGWSYSATAPGSSPSFFFGLIRGELVEVGDSESF